MIIQKNVINSINKAYMNVIKELYQTNKNTDATNQYIIYDTIIADKRVEFRLTCKQQSSGDQPNIYIAWAKYTPWQIKRKYTVEIFLDLNNDLMNPIYFGEINLRVKSLIYHELEHHLQRIKTPFRAFLDLKAYTGKDDDYVNSDAEIEAYSKQYYFIHKKSKVGFSTLVDSESKNISNDPLLQLRFKKRIYKFLRRRKDLNLLLNIQI